ncbi:response regulator [Allostella humosa]|uniref:response regulator n=1 Tax=Stella humosa TaxID=94 RepID=UPI0014771A17|nr:response regulator [Stella humosa]
MLIAMLIEGMLAAAGCAAVIPVADLEAAIIATDREQFDVAVLDLNLNGQDGSLVARALRSLGIPFIFASGYGPGGVPAEFLDVPFVSKPFKASRLIEAIGRVLAARP